MSYQANKPFGRRRTDKPLTADERRHLETIRRDVDDDSSGLIRRYLRLSEKALKNESNGNNGSKERPYLVERRGVSARERVA